MNGLRHFGISVRNMTKSLEFYRDLLGLKILSDELECGPFVDTLLNLKNTKVRTVKLSSNGTNVLLELLEFQSHKDKTDPKRQIYSYGPTHIAFTVNSADEIYAKLNKAGIQLNAKPQLSVNGKAKVFYGFDPDGTPLEWVEMLKDTA